MIRLLHHDACDTESGYVKIITNYSKPGIRVTSDMPCRTEVLGETCNQLHFFVFWGHDPIGGINLHSSIQHARRRPRLGLSPGALTTKDEIENADLRNDREQ